MHPILSDANSDDLMLFGLFHNPSFHLARNFQHSFPFLLYLLPFPSLSHRHTSESEREREREKEFNSLHSFCLSLMPLPLPRHNLCTFWHLLEQFLLISWENHFVSFICYKWSAASAPQLNIPFMIHIRATIPNSFSSVPSLFLHKIYRDKCNTIS